MIKLKSFALANAKSFRLSNSIEFDLLLWFRELKKANKMKPSLPPLLIRNKNKQWNFPTTFCPFSSSLFRLNIYDPNLHDR